MFHIAICDDDMEFTNNLKNLINRYSAEAYIEVRLSLYSDGLDLIEDYHMDIDLIFLDIQMTHMSGLEAAEQIRKIDSGVSIVFLTSLAQYALEGYKYNATNYIIKPIKYVRLKSELDKWRQRFPQKEIPYILVSNSSGKYKVFLNTLRYVETFNRKLMLHTESENILSYSKLKDMEEELSKSNFVRCHSSYLVNLFFVKRVEKLEIVLISEERIPISQPKRKLFMERLAEYWGATL